MITELIDKWAVDSDLQGLAPRTIIDYRDIITKFFERCPKNPGAVNLQDIKKYLLRFKATPKII